MRLGAAQFVRAGCFLAGLAIAALLIGVADTACKYWIPELGAFLVYAATITILLWRPQGLFERRSIEKV